jgi:hypothetical protein
MRAGFKQAGTMLAEEVCGQDGGFAWRSALTADCGGQWRLCRPLRQPRMARPVTRVPYQGQPWRVSCYALAPAATLTFFAGFWNHDTMQACSVNLTAQVLAKVRSTTICAQTRQACQAWVHVHDAKRNFAKRLRFRQL